MLEKKCVIYARVSSKEQEQEGFSIDAQLKLLRGYAFEHRLTVAKEYIDVESAKRAGREKFTQMCNDLLINYEWRVILCEKTDRLTRNFNDVALLDEMINRNGIALIFVKENCELTRDSKSTEKFIFGIKALMAKNYIDNLSEETKKGMQEKAEQGLFPSNAPLGYINIQISGNCKPVKIIAPDPERAPKIRKLFEAYADQRSSLKSLVKLAAEIGLRTRKGNILGESSIHRILNNHIYYGVFEWNGKQYNGSHEPIISKEHYDLVQQRLHTLGHPNVESKTFAYSRLLKCARCGCSIVAELKKGKYIYYHCTKAKGDCSAPYLREDALGDLLADIVKRIHVDAESAELIKQALHESHREEITFNKNCIDTLEAQRKTLERRLHQLYTDKVDGKISEPMYVDMFNTWQGELGAIQSGINRHRQADTNYLIHGSQILELCNKAYGMYLKRSHQQRAELLHCVLSNCTLDGTTIHPTYKKPFDLFAEGLHRPNWLPMLVK